MMIIITKTCACSVVHDFGCYQFVKTLYLCLFMYSGNAWSKPRWVHYQAELRVQFRHVIMLCGLFDVCFGFYLFFPFLVLVSEIAWFSCNLFFQMTKIFQVYELLTHHIIGCFKFCTNILFNWAYEQCIVSSHRIEV